MENYKFIKQIGEGSYGKVQLARAPDGKNVVIKVVDTRRMNQKEKKSAQNEVKVLSALKHPYVVRYYESFISTGKLCIVMAFAEKGDLYSRIKAARNGRRIPAEKVLEWFTQATLALKYLHDLRILHRDLKSQNMFLTGEERLKIGDFGISRVLSSTGAFARTMIGTPYYMSPEVCSERPYSWASDIWALGCVLYELYQLKVPFEAASIRDLMQRIIRGQIPRATNACHAGQMICAEMMAREPGKRPTAAQILERPLIQEAIRGMLKHHHSTEGSFHKAAPAAQADPQVLQQQNARPVAAMSPRMPSPSRGARSPSPNVRGPSPSPNLPPRARGDSPRVGGPRGLPPKAGLQRDPSAPAVLDGRYRPVGMGHGVPPSPRWNAGSPRQYMPPSPRAHRAPSPGPVRWTPREGPAPPDPNDWYQKALGILRS
jgi:NIMA (never in mitosis gene a)-related kinase